MSAASVRARLLSRAREEIDRAAPSERARALVALAQSGEPEDVGRAEAASEGNEVLRAALAAHLAKRGQLEQASALVATLRERGPRGYAAYTIAQAAAALRSKWSEEIP